MELAIFCSGGDSVDAWARASTDAEDTQARTITSLIAQSNTQEADLIRITRILALRFALRVYSFAVSFPSVQRMCLTNGAGNGNRALCFERMIMWLGRVGEQINDTVLGLFEAVF